jgi:hypothetical protein
MNSNRNQINSGSSSGYNRAKQNGNTRKPFCKVCFDAKKPREVYESHWVKDREGKVTCVTLLEQECRYCFKAGHTVKFCPEIARVNSEKERASTMDARRRDAEARREREEKQFAQKKAQENASKHGGFAALCCDSDDEEQPMKAQKKEDWPSLPTSTKAKPVAKGVSFAAALQKTKLEYESDEIAKANAKTTLGAGFAVLTRDNTGNLKITQSESKDKTSEKEFVKTAVKPVTIPKTFQTVQQVNEKKKDEFLNGKKKISCWYGSDEEDNDEDAYDMPARDNSVSQPKIVVDAWED